MVDTTQRLQDVPWIIYVEDPLTVMQMIRRNEHTTKIQIACNLAKQGIPFKMLQDAGDMRTLPVTPDTGETCKNEVVLTVFNRRNRVSEKS